jgi:hypothetical protein
MTRIYKLSDNTQILRQIPYQFSRFDGSQNPAFAFFAKTVISDDTLIDVMSAAGTDLDYLIEYNRHFYNSNFGEALAEKLRLNTAQLNIALVRQMVEDGDKNLDKIVADFANPLLYTIRSLVNDLLYSVITPEVKERDPIGDDILAKFIDASRAGDRVSKSIREALTYLSTVIEGVTVSDDGIKLSAEMKPLLMALMRTHAHTLLVGGQMRWLDRSINSSTMLMSVNSVTHTLLMVIDENTYKTDEEDEENPEECEPISADIVIAEKFLCLLSGEDPSTVSELMKKISKLTISSIKMANGIHRQLINSDAGIQQSSMSSGKKLKRTTPKMKSLYHNPATKNAVLQKISKRELPHHDRASFEKVGDGDLYVMIDVSGSTVEAYGSTAGVFLLFEAMGIAIVNAARAAKKDCTVMFYGDAVTHQVDFKDTDTELTHRRKLTEMTNHTGPHGNNEMLSLQWAFEQVRRRNGKKPTTVIMITDGGVLTEYGNGDADPVNQFKLELSTLKSDVKTDITILPIIVNPNLDKNFRKAFAGTEFVHIKHGSHLTPKTLTDIMRYVVTLDSEGNDTINVVPQ